MKRRLFAIIISIALIATLMPTFAFAEVSANCTCNHEFKKVERPATLTKDGYKGYECTKCGKHKDGKKIRHPETFKLSKKTYVYKGEAATSKGKARKSGVLSATPQSSCLKPSLGHNKKAEQTTSPALKT